MDFWSVILKVLEVEMEQPEPYGWFHLLCWGVVIGLTALLCTRYRNCSRDKIRRVVFAVAVIVAVLEVYKQIVFSLHSSDTGVYFDYQWYSFPWQFCSIPMYVGLLTRVFRKGKIHDALCAFLATYAVFAGVCVMFYPTDVFIDLVGINIQTMVCHGSMIVIGVWLLVSGYVKPEKDSFWGAAAVFVVAVGLALLLNEGAWHTGIIGDETFNMFFISRHMEPSLPVYLLVQQVVPYPWCLVIYVAAFSLAAYIILMAPVGISRLCAKGKKPVAV